MRVNTDSWNELPEKSESSNALHCIAEKNMDVGSWLTLPKEAESWNALLENLEGK